MRRLIVTTAMLVTLLLPQTAGAVTPAADTTVKFTTFRTPVQRGKQAKVTVHTRANLKCSIKVVYQGGKSRAAGLGSKYANGSGNATWTWTVPANTTPKAWPVTVTCQSGGYGVKTSRNMTITA